MSSNFCIHYDLSNSTVSSFSSQMISSEDEENARKIHDKTGFSLDQLRQMSSDDLMMIELQIEEFQIACTIFDEEQILHNLEFIIDNLDVMCRYSVGDALTIRALSTLPHKKDTFPILVTNLMIGHKCINIGHKCINLAEFLKKHNNLIEAFYKLNIDLEEFISYISPIKDNIFFANRMADEFVIICQNSKRSPIDILSMEPRKFVYFLSKAKLIEERICDTADDPLSSFDLLFDLQIDDLRRTFPYTNRELRAFNQSHYTRLAPESAEDIRKLSYNICPIDHKIARSENIQGGLQLPFYPLVLSALTQVERDPQSKANIEVSKKIEKLRNALLSSWDIGLIYHPTEVRSEFCLPKRIEGRKEIASQLIITRLKENAAESNDEAFDFIFHGGWQGHAIMYGISFDPVTKTYSFSIWNTGDGLQRHPKIQIDPSEFNQQIGDFNDSLDRYMIRATWSDLRFNQVTDQSFLEMLIEEQVANVVKDPDLTYDKINSHFGKPQDSKSPDDIGYHRAQKHGNCSWKSFWAASRDLLEIDHKPFLSIRVKLETMKGLDRVMSENVAKKNSTSTDLLLEESIQLKITKISGKTT